MTWPANTPACFGIGCSHHLDCARYQAVEGNTNHEQMFIAMCGPTLPLYMPVQPIKEVKSESL